MMQPKDVLQEIERELGFLEGLSWALEAWACEMLMEKATEIRKKIEKMQEEHEKGERRMMSILAGTGYMNSRDADSPCVEVAETTSKSPQSAAPTAPLTFKGSLGDTDCHVANAPRNDGGVGEMWEEMRANGG